METQNNILPIQVKTSIDEAVRIICTIHSELWDEAIGYAVDSIKSEAIERGKHHIFGAKFCGDVHEQLRLIENQSAYRVFRQEHN